MARQRRTTRPARHTLPAGCARIGCAACRGHNKTNVRIPWALSAVVLSALGLVVVGLSDLLCAAAVAMLLGLAAIGMAYSIWSALHPWHWRDPLRFLRDVVNPVVPLLALLGVALVFQGLGELAGWAGLRALGRAVAELFGGS